MYLFSKQYEQKKKNALNSVRQALLNSFCEELEEFVFQK